MNKLVYRTENEFMTTKELIKALETLPSDSEVFANYNSTIKEVHYCEEDKEVELR